jgi:hypothetical protein
MSQVFSIYITWLFSINNEAEVAQTGVHVTDTLRTLIPFDEAWAEVGDGELAALDTAMAKLIDLPALNFADYSMYNGVKAAFLNGQGKYEADPLLRIRATPKNGESIGILPQASIVGTLRAATDLGKATHGRMYLPYTGPNSWNSNSPRIPPGLMQPIANGFGDFIGDVNAAFTTVNSSTGMKLEASILHNAPGGVIGVFNRVASVAVGDVVDTQRRRRAQISEAYRSAPLT